MFFLKQVTNIRKSREMNKFIHGSEASVDYLLENVQSLKNWRSDDVGNVLDILEQEIQEWSKRKERIFKRALLSDAVSYLRENML